jgi:RNA polymerase sigma factor (sigma-70 family)
MLMRTNNINNVTTKTTTTGFNVHNIDFTNYSLLNIDDELKNLNEAKYGNIMAIEKIVSSNFRFVVSIALQYIDLGIPLNDLIKEGNLGLIKAIDRYDNTKGIKFSNYAICWIRSFIIASINENTNVVKAPVSTSKNYSKIKAAISLHTQQLETEPDYETVMIYGKLSTDEIHILIRIYFNNFITLETLNNEDQEYTQISSFLQKLHESDYNGFNKHEFQYYIKNTLGKVLCNEELEKVWELYNFKLMNNYKNFIHSN